VAKRIRFFVKLWTVAAICLVIFCFEAFAIKPPPGGFFFGIKWGTRDEGFFGMKWGTSIEDFKRQEMIKDTNGYYGPEIQGILYVSSNIHKDLQIGDLKPHIQYLFYMNKFTGLSIEPYPMKRKTVKTLFAQYGYPVDHEELKDPYGVILGEDYIWIVDNVRIKLRYTTQTSLIYYYIPLFNEWKQEQKRKDKNNP
jgi:hypothetical protein